nr:SPOR domain-containing protein [Parerythrobacter lacustris]
MSPALLAWPTVAAAQEIVQPLPPKELGQLNAALRRISQNPQDVEALLDAGEASLVLDDINAAEGFFLRAEALAPGNPRVLLGLGRAAVRARDPLKSIGLFDSAEEAGAKMASVALDRGLAYDLVGDNVSAQAEYRKGLTLAEDDELRRRLSLSLAIAGDKEGFQNTLNPLVARGDSASYRTRAFGLAILGEDDEAVEIAAAVMPREMSARIEPYLRYMKRLTPSQQAAAGNLGVFPRAAQIGRDTPQVAQYREQKGLVRTADARLAPQGEPLGQRVDTTSQRRRPDRGRSVAAEPVAEASSALPESVRREVARAEREQASDPLQRTSRPAVVVRRIERDAPTTDDSGDAVAQPAQILASEPAENQALAAAPTGIAVRELPVTPVELPAAEASEVTPPTGIAVREVQASQPAMSVTGTVAAPEPGFDIARVESVPVAASISGPTAAEVEETLSVAEAFAAFAEAAPPVPSSSGGVDITSIKPPREVEKPAPPPTPKIVHPSRHWVQVATGKDLRALGFDWRRFSGKAPDVLGKLKPNTTPWGEANRLLAGPYPSLQEARKALNLLKEKGIEGFTYTSPEGQEIKPLG